MRKQRVCFFAAEFGVVASYKKVKMTFLPENIGEAITSRIQCMYACQFGTVAAGRLRGPAIGKMVNSICFTVVAAMPPDLNCDNRKGR